MVGTNHAPTPHHFFVLLSFVFFVPFVLKAFDFDLDLDFFFTQLPVPRSNDAQLRLRVSTHINTFLLLENNKLFSVLGLVLDG